MARIRIVTGHFGSGKTEIALNYAVKLGQQRNRVCLVDMDIVNPFFCARDMGPQLESQGIRLISAQPNLSNAELAVISPEVMAIFNDPTYEVVVDVGGDDMGAVALGQFNRYFRKEPYDMSFVINKNRPLTSTQEGVTASIRSIENASRLKVTHLISNTNMSYETTVDDILRGDDFVSELAADLHIPHQYTVCRKDLLGGVDGRVRGEIFDIDVYMKTPWM
ncbi:ATP-binding protein [Alicyclobacillaceae bacterium I2511]|nr:ATP-binding protein [Alicyclobacillaceae bacterium I2511]